KYLFNNKDVEVVFDITRKTFAGNIDAIRQKYENEKLSPEMLLVIGKMTGYKEIMEMGSNKEIDNICTALEKLKQQGIEQRIEQGIEQGKLTIIRNLLSHGISKEEVMKIAGVTEEEIRQAKNSLE